MPLDARQIMLDAYGIPRWMYVEGIPISYPKNLHYIGSRRRNSATYHLRELGCLVYWSDQRNMMGHSKRKLMDVEHMVSLWKETVVGLATAHDKDTSDRYEASIEKLLTPILVAPIKQVRELAEKLNLALKNDTAVPFLVWRGFEIWYEQMKNAPDGEVKELKTALAQEIVEMVEDDAKRDLPAAMIHALQWRSPEQLEEVKKTVQKEKAAGREVRLRGRESCLFLEAGGTEKEPDVCIQV